MRDYLRHRFFRELDTLTGVLQQRAYGNHVGNIQKIGSERIRGKVYGDIFHVCARLARVLVGCRPTVGKPWSKQQQIAGTIEVTDTVADEMLAERTLRVYQFIAGVDVVLDFGLMKRDVHVDGLVL